MENNTLIKVKTFIKNLEFKELYKVDKVKLDKDKYLLNILFIDDIYGELGYYRGYNKFIVIFKVHKKGRFFFIDISENFKLIAEKKEYNINELKENLKIYFEEIQKNVRRI